MSWKQLASPLAVILLGVMITAAVLAAPVNAPTAAPQLQGYPPTGDSYPNPSASVTATATLTTTTVVSTTPGTAQQSVLTPTLVRSATAATPTSRPTASPTFMPTPEEEAAIEATPTPADSLTCVPGAATLITGQGPPRAALLLSFEQRVVGGGSVETSGLFAIPLVVGKERPGNYRVEVRIRGTTQVLRELTCTVPAAPAPTPVEPN